jgi:hypothetical protein
VLLVDPISAIYTAAAAPSDGRSHLGAIPVFQRPTSDNNTPLTGKILPMAVQFQRESTKRDQKVISPVLNTDQANLVHKIIETIGIASLGVHMSGEHGLGKEAVVRLLYARSPRRGTPFIKVNCPMLSVPHGSDHTPCINPVASCQDNSSLNLLRFFIEVCCICIPWMRWTWHCRAV